MQLFFGIGDKHRTRLFFPSLLLIIFLVGVSILLLIERDACADKGQPVKITIAGDLLIGDGRVWKQLIETNYSRSILGGYSQYLGKSDLTLANFEGIIAQKSEMRFKDLPARFSLKTDPAIIVFLKKIPNLVLSFANNHSADFGLDAITEAIGIFSQEKIDYVGMGVTKENALDPRIKTIRGFRIAVLAFTDLLPREYYATENSGGVAELTAENLQATIAAAKSSADFVIVSLHTADDIGGPFSVQPDTHQRIYSRLAIDYGADVVVGQHPHGLQSFERYKDKLIFYSLGLFLYDPSVSGRYPSSHPLFQATQFHGGGILNLKVCKSGVSDFKLMPVKVIDYKGNLMLAPSL